MTGQIVLLRHGESIWNAEKRFTGQTDIELTDLGRAEARRAGYSLRQQNLRLDAVFSSDLTRAFETASLALEGSSPLNDHLRNKAGSWQIVTSEALRERDYGELTGHKKEDVIKAYGADQVKLWRRSYDIRPPNGESLADVLARVAPYFDQHIAPLVQSGKRVLIGGHEHSLRAIMIHTKNKTQENIIDCELENGVPVVVEMK
jgi:2,3-bisphosphoglycerate-dependent phosphoglycerate mutase